MFYHHIFTQIWISHVYDIYCRLPENREDHIKALQEWFTPGNLIDLCPLQRSFSESTCFYVDTGQDLDNVSDAKNLQFVRDITLGVNHSYPSGSDP